MGAEPNAVLYITSESSLLDAGKLKVDLYNLLDEAGSSRPVIIATPNISLKDVEAALTRRTFASIANKMDLDLSVIFCLPEPEGTDARWELGWVDGNGQVVFIYPKEYFTNEEAWIEFLKEVAFKCWRVTFQ